MVVWMLLTFSTAPFAPGVRRFWMASSVLLLMITEKAGEICDLLSGGPTYAWITSRTLIIILNRRF